MRRFHSARQVPLCQREASACAHETVRGKGGGPPSATNKALISNGGHGPVNKLL